jgi:hypothetical protein
MHYFVVRETRARIRLPIGLRCWVYPVGYADRQNLSIGSSFITLLEQFTQLTLFPSGCRIIAFVLQFESVECNDVLRSD